MELKGRKERLRVREDEKDDRTRAEGEGEWFPVRRVTSHFLILPEVLVVLLEGIPRYHKTIESLDVLRIFYYEL